MPTLVDLLTDWLPDQRWYAGKGREVTALGVEVRTELGDVAGVTVLDLVVAVEHAGDTVRYQVPVTLHDAPLEGFDAALLGQSDEGLVYDGLVDPAGAGRWLEHLAAGAMVSGLRFEHDHFPMGLLGLPGRVVGAEQSNTSVIYGDLAILKVFRRLAPGLNPDLEVTGALAAAGSKHVARPYGSVTGEVLGEPTTLAFLQDFLRQGTEGWKLALASVRDLLAEGDLRADEVGGDFASESERLGAAVADVHAMLAEVLPSEVVGEADSRRTGAQLHERLDVAITEVPELAVHADGLRVLYDAFAARPGEVLVQRVHGDLHLGQVLRTDSDWVLLDFEGEPARPLAERTTLMSPIRDVAGMLRSFDYAAQSLLADSPGDDQRRYRATEWSKRNRDAFCDGYAAAAGADPRADALLLKALEADKAVYEVVYEARHRPSWIAIPMAAVARLAAG